MTHVYAQAPRAALRPFVRRFLVVEFPDAHRDWHLPDTGLVAAFSLRGSCRLDDGSLVPRAAITGLWDRRRHHVHGRGHWVVLAAFTPTGAAAWVRAPLHELANTTIPLDAVLSEGAACARLEEQLVEAPDHAARVRRLEDFLLKRIGSAQPDALVSAAVSWIERAPPGARIDALVRHIGLSQSALERRFRRVVGATPKRFASLVRLQSILRLRGTGATLTSIAHAAGYFDQAHFIHDFKRVAGLAPEAYFNGESPPAG